MFPIFQGLCECPLHWYVPILNLGGKEHATQATEKAVSFRPLKTSIIKPCCINFWILYLCHCICTSTVSVLLKSSLPHWCLLSISHTTTYSTQHSKDYFSKMVIVIKASNSDIEFQVLQAVTKCACCSWMHSSSGLRLLISYCYYNCSQRCLLSWRVKLSWKLMFK